ncbi:MAG: bifunctional 5,10-methylenetetrahydrofolate dehydrogenase/5,10-methenyltetrahydrofolate cyclohydrolase [Candidatus Cloacimonadota bacterium]|nr:bifunctional 5,10-methylenetetrahydrofolate dehydrogenase/5,10-methenyltetrahydrofolate cyclohydrolase [Candidatus Cloacimonadota bacterium]
MMNLAKKLKAKPITKEVYSNLKETIRSTNLIPKLVIIILGNDPAAVYYMNNLKKKGEKIGVSVKILRFSTKMSQSELISKIKGLNQDNEVHAIMLQKPLPKQIKESEIVKTIVPEKDVDGFHPMNMGKLVLDQDSFLPSTSAAVLKILDFYDIPTEGKRITILGRSNIVGKPLANLLLRKNKTGNATVTVCHSHSQEVEKIIKESDVLIAAIGKANYVKKEMIPNGITIIDVGINQVKNSEGKDKYVGDVDFFNCQEKAAQITPVPGGVGSVTTAMLLGNVVKAALEIKKNR